VYVYAIFMVIMVVMARWSQEYPVHVGQLGEVEEMEISGGGDSYSYGATVTCGIWLPLFLGAAAPRT
jgi:hypothetical protein